MVFHTTHKCRKRAHLCNLDGAILKKNIAFIHIIFRKGNVNGLLGYGNSTCILYHLNSSVSPARWWISSSISTIFEKYHQDHSWSRREHAGKTTGCFEMEKPPLMADPIHHPWQVSYENPKSISYFHLIQECLGACCTSPYLMNLRKWKRF